MLNDPDFRADGKAKVVQNPASAQIQAPVAVQFEPLLDPSRREQLLATLDARAGSQRGKPRSQDPARNPLGCRIFDLNCTWPMYRCSAA